MSTLQRDPRDRVQVLDDDGRVVDGAEVPDLDDDDPAVVVEYLHAVARVSLQRTHDSLRRIRQLSEAGGIVFT